MNSFQMAWRSAIRKPMKSILLFLVVFVISLFFLSGMASRNASIATQNKTKQAVGAGFVLEGNEANKHNRADEILAKKDDGAEGNFDGVDVEKMETEFGTSWRVSYDNSFQTLLKSDIEKIAAVSGISDYNITTAVTAVNPVNFSRIEEEDVDQSSDLLCVSLIGNKNMALDSNVLSGNVEVTDGRMITEEDFNVCVISEELAEKNDLSVGGKLQFNDRRAIENAEICEAEIVGIYQTRQKMTPIMDGDTYRSENIIFTDLGFPEKAEGSTSGPLYEKAYFKVADVNQYDVLKKEIQEVDIGWERYDLIDKNGNIDKMSQNFNDLENASEILVIVVAGASLVLLFLVFVFWMKGRGQEIGILLALGTLKIKIFGQILLEAFMIAAAAVFFSVAAAPAASEVMAGYLVEQQVQQADERSILEKGKVAKTVEDPEETVSGVSVEITPKLMLYDSIGVLVLIIISVGTAGILIARKNPKDIFSEIN
ncbi:MAG: ABC transporter permease [Lachnospiraceae bacterium]|nr:ABC transporter permease [Lachnospiraceae bacterium]